MRQAVTDKQAMDAFSGVRWSALSKYGAQGIQLVVSIVLARLLAPEYFGLLGMAMVVTRFLKTFKNLGINAAIIQRKEIGDALISTLFWVNLVVCVLVAGGVAALAPGVARMYGDPRVAPIVAVLAINFVLAGFTMIPTALLNRQMAFDKLALREIGAAAVNGATSITLALLGWGVWALVWGTIAGAVGRALFINLVCPFRPRFVLDRSGLRECLGFGLNLTGFNIFNSVSRNADNLIIGVFLGATPLGYYSLAYKLMLLPRNTVSRVVARVMFPKLSRLQDDDTRLAEMYLRANASIAFVTFPLMFGFAAIARPFVDVVLGAKWLSAVPLLSILAPLGAAQSIWSPVGQVFLAKGRGDWYFRWGAAGGLLFVTSFFAGLRWGVVGVASSYAVASLLWAPISWWIAFRLVDELTVGRLLARVGPYIALSCGMAAVVLLVRFGLESLSVSPSLVLAASIVTGMTFYGVGVVAWRLEAVDDLIRLLPGSLSRLAAKVAMRPGFKST